LAYAWTRGINKKIVIFTGAFFIIWPQFGIYTVTIWKDVMYSILTLLLGFVVYLYVVDESKRNSRVVFSLIVVASALVASFRFNGLIFLFIPSLFLLLLKKMNWKRALSLFVGTIGLYLFISTILLNILNVRVVPAMMDSYMIKAIGGIYSLNQPNLSGEEEAAFLNLQPEKDWVELYDCESQNELVINVMKRKKTNSYSLGIEPNPVKEAAFHRAFYSALLKNPQGYIKDRLCLADNMLGYGSRNNFTYVAGITRAEWHPLVEERPKLPYVKQVLKNYLGWTMDVNWSLETKLRYDIFWATWPMLAVSLSAFAFSVLRKYPGLGVYSLFILINLGTILAISPAVDYRYVYFVYVCAPFIPILFLIEKNARAINPKR